MEQELILYCRESEHQVTAPLKGEGCNNAQLAAQSTQRIIHCVDWAAY